MDQDNAPTLALKPVEVIRYVVSFGDEDHKQHRPEGGHLNTAGGAEMRTTVIESHVNGPYLFVQTNIGNTRAHAFAAADLTAAEARTLAAQLLAGAELLEQLQGGAA